MKIFKAFKSSLRKSNKGFTLIEMTVSIFIIGMILGLMLANYKYGQKSSELKVAALKVAGDIRRAQNYAMSLKASKNSAAIMGGWGIHFDKSSGVYSIFADNLDDPAVFPDGNKTYETAEMEEDISLPNNIQISAINIIPASDILDIVFSPPDPVTYLNTSSSTVASITLQEKSGNATSTIMINPFGLIEVLN